MYNTLFDSRPNGETLTMNGSSSVYGNVAAEDGGGFFTSGFVGSILTLTDSSSVHDIRSGGSGGGISG